MRHNPKIRDFALERQGRGKLTKVVITACMRKLLTIMNTIVKTGQPRQRSDAPATA